MPHTCQVCGDPAAHRCKQCGKTHYCGKECQTSDWPVHEPICAGLTLGRLKVSLGLSARDEQRLATVLDAIVGMAMGHACGDTLGARVLGLPADYFAGADDVLKRLVDGDPEAARESPALRYPDLALGALTDASEHWMVTAHALIADGNKPGQATAEWRQQWQASKPPRMTLRDDRTDSRMLLRASVYAINTWSNKGTRELLELVRKDARQATDDTDAVEAAVAYALICRGLIRYTGLERATRSLADASDHLRAASPGGAALQALDAGRQNAELNPFSAEASATNQAVSPSAPDTYHKSLGAVSYFLQTATRRSDGAAMWTEAVANMLAADGQSNVTAALVGEVLGGYYTQSVLPRQVFAAVLAHTETDRPTWLRAFRLLYLSETLARNGAS